MQPYCCNDGAAAVTDDDHYRHDEDDYDHIDGQNHHSDDQANEGNDDNYVECEYEWKYWYDYQNNQ